MNQLKIVNCVGVQTDRKSDAKYTANVYIEYFISNVRHFRILFAGHRGHIENTIIADFWQLLLSAIKTTPLLHHIDDEIIWQE